MTTFGRVFTGKAGKDRRGLWIRDKDTGTIFRAGEVGQEMGYHLGSIGETSLAREVISKPHFGIFVSKEF